MQTVLYIAAIIALVFVNGFFVAAEFALVGVRRSRIRRIRFAPVAGGGTELSSLLIPLVCVSLSMI
jgi:CBS domain containing-hemolysin-like protein